MKSMAQLDYDLGSYDKCIAIDYASTCLEFYDKHAPEKVMLD
jgi:hypothetical protein